MDKSNILNSSGFINIGSICNAKCYFCIKSNVNLLISKKSIINLINNYLKVGIFDIRYGTGEFTVHPDFFDIIEYGKKLGINQYIHSNGIKFSDENFIKKIKDLGINNINISLHGIKAITNDKILGIEGSFKKIIKGIRNLKKYGFKISISYVITSDNIEEILGIYLFSIKNNFSLLKFSLLMGGHNYNNEIIPSLNEILIQFKKISKINNNFKFNVKLLNFPYCLIEKKYKEEFIYENGGNSNGKLLLICKKCKFSSFCSGFPNYYKIDEFINIIKKYVEN